MDLSSVINDDFLRFYIEIDKLELKDMWVELQRLFIFD
jgi:hypothetical protein